MIRLVFTAADLRGSLGGSQRAAAACRLTGSTCYHAACCQETALHVGSDFKARAVCLASPKVADLLLNIVLQSERLKVQQFLVAAQGSPQLAGLRGLLCEAYGHRVSQVGKPCVQGTAASETS